MNIKDEIIDGLQQEVVKLRLENTAIRQAARDICDKWVNPDMYGQAMSEIAKVYEQPPEQMSDE